MSYIDQAHDPRRRANAVIAVAAIHAALGYVLVTGLGGKIVERFVPPPLVGTQIPLPPPPPEPEPTEAAEPAARTPTAPVPPIPIPQPSAPRVERFDQDDVAPPAVTRLPDPGPTVRPDPPRPTPSFTPQAARPRNSSAGWISNDDYPRRALIDGAEGTARYRLVVGTNGRVASCEITTSSGNGQLDEATCSLLTRRARFEAATDESGSKVLGTYSGAVRWDIPD